MVDRRMVARVAGGSAAALCAAVAWGVDGDAAAGRARGIFGIQVIDVRDRTDVPANHVIEVLFSSAIDEASVSPATVQVRAENATGTGYTKQVFGSFQVAGNVLRFFPRLPGHLRDADGEFFLPGSKYDDAAENAGLQPSTKYQLTIIGRPAVTPVRSKVGRPLRRTVSARFTTASSASAEALYTTRTYSDSPPPQYSFSNPPDTVPSPDTQYATRGGTQGVPNDLSVQVYCTRVPLSPSAARVSGNVVLTMLERYGNPELRRPVPGTVYVEQNYETSLLVFKPQFPLADRGLYSLRVSKNLKDLTEQYDFLPNRDRERLRQIYEHLSTARANSPYTPWTDLPDPPQSLVGDWPPPEDTEARGVLKTNVLTLGDAYPDEFDPRVMVVFTTRDEPITNAELRIEFLKSDGLYEATLSTGEWDQTVPGAASAILTIAGGSAVDGDLFPTGNMTLTPTAATGYTYNFRDVVIPQGVTITFGGANPVTLKAINFTLNGTIEISGATGRPGNYSSKNAVPGGAGGPGGGQGGDSNTTVPSTADRAANKNTYGGDGRQGIDSEGNNPSTFGGKGGLGGGSSTGTYYSYGGGGGGGGARLAGKTGQAGTSAIASWNGTGGQGGAGSSNTELNPLVGGAGGGSGGIGGMANDHPSFGGSWYTTAGSGGGGGGAILIQTAKVLNISDTGRIRARGGVGAVQATTGYGSGGPGGGGGGGSILLRSTGAFNIVNPGQAFDLAGGLGGGGGGSYQNRGGDGGAGYLRNEDPNGGITMANSSQGTFNPVGAGVPSFVYSKWADLGVQDPRILAWSNEDIKTEPTSNDAVYVMAQATREDPAVFGAPDTNSIDGSQNTLDPSVTSPWIPIKIHDRTGLPGTGAFPVPGYDPGVDGTEYAGFPVDALNGRGFKFVRFRIYFQLDATQSVTEPLPNVDYIITHYQYNL